MDGKQYRDKPKIKRTDDVKRQIEDDYGTYG